MRVVGRGGSAEPGRTPGPAETAGAYTAILRERPLQPSVKRAAGKVVPTAASFLACPSPRDSGVGTGDRPAG